MTTTLISLRELSRKIKSEISKGNFPDQLLGDFLDDFRLRAKSREAKSALVKEKPESIQIEGFKDADAYLAAVAEYLCREAGLPPPTWTEEPEFFLHEPWFAGGLENLKAILLVESPVPFRRRNLFVSANAMTRV
ncbi:MAG: hypothetical protein AB1585_11565 [Thermodesulfobacteriota bacterium]